jgi:Outer membrane protein beta-barrel domain
LIERVETYKHPQEHPENPAKRVRRHCQKRHAGKPYKLTIMKKLFLLPAIFIGSYWTGHAQMARFGFSAGTTFANYTAKDDGENDNGKSITGIIAGVLVDIPAGNHFSFQPAVNFVQKGTKDQQGTEKIKLTVNAIEVPLNFVYNAPGNKGNFFIGAGPSIAFAISGKGKYDDGTNSVSVDLHFGTGDDDIMKGLDVGANFITGFQFQSGLLFSVNYNAGLNNLSTGGSADGTLKSHYFGIKLGYLLNSKGKK